MASETRSRSATRASGGREVICRLRRGYHSHLPWCGRRRDDGGDLRRGIGSQQLQLLRGDWHAGFGRLDRRPHAHLRVSGGRARDHRPRQSEVAHHQSLPLRAECQSDVRSSDLIVPDNLKSRITQACRYEPSVNRTYAEMAAHYGVAVIPARRAKPRDKAKVEAGVLLVERWILAALRKRKFFHLAEVNQAIQELLVRLNYRPFRKREGSRRSLFESLDKPALRALPAARYQYGDWETHRVNIDYHVEFDNHWYSVPYQLTQQEVEVRATAATVEIFHRGLRVASHARSHVAHVATTVNDHRPKAHQRHLEWTPSRLVDWAKTIRPATGELFDRIMASKPHPEQGYRSCLGILRLSKQYTN